MRPELTGTKARTQDDARHRARQAARGLLISSAGAALTALGARVTIPWWPVPATLQVFFVLLCGAALGRRWGAAAQAQYVLAGTLGLPVFAAGSGGPGALMGPTGGYLVGFVVAAYLTGWLSEVRGRRGAPSYAAALAGAAMIWLCGWAWLALWAAAKGEATPLRAAFAWGVMPFIALDALKAAAAAAIARPLSRTLNPRGG
ncbi:MAG TPA: biotin transporter BioY [Armatimonadota bacterium]|nr:biotin transporter BioY [Armatimonadota bacterium]